MTRFFSFSSFVAYNSGGARRRCLAHMGVWEGKVDRSWHSAEREMSF